MVNRGVGVSLGVQILNALEELLEADACIRLIVGPAGQHCIQQLSSHQQLCDQIHLHFRSTDFKSHEQPSTTCNFVCHDLSMGGSC